MPTSSREYDPEIKDIADYVANKTIDSELAVSFVPWLLMPACPSFPKTQKSHENPTITTTQRRGAKRMNSNPNPIQSNSPELERESLTDCLPLPSSTPLDGFS